MRRLVVLFFLAACDPSDDEYLEAVKPRLPPGSKIESWRVETCCANTGKMVYVTISTPTGKQACVFQPSRTEGKLQVSGNSADAQWCRPVPK
jgi:hypothetical protein